MPISKTLAHYRARVAHESRYDPDGPKLVAARRDLSAAKLTEQIRQLSPALSDQQRAQLAELLAPAGA